MYTYGTRVLRTKAKPVTKIDEELIKLIMDMFDIMHAANGIGLAANQVGKLRRVIVVDISDIEKDEKTTDEDLKHRFKPYPPIALINPEIVLVEGKWTMEEGCLSIPNVRDPVERDEKITIRYKDASFHDVQIETDGLLARVILHEIDHLNGVLFIDHLSAQQRKVHKEQLKQIQRGEFEVDYPVITATSYKVETE